MKGGKCDTIAAHNSLIATPAITNWRDGKMNNYSFLNNPTSNLHKNSKLFLEQSLLANPQIKIICEDDDKFNLQLAGTCNGDTFVYTNDQKAFKSTNFNDLKIFISKRENQLRFIRSCLKSPQLRDKCIKNSNS